MTDIIYISSSEDEEDLFKKQSTSMCQNQKRKISTSLDDKNDSKKQKKDDANKVFNDSSESNKNLIKKVIRPQLVVHEKIPIPEPSQDVFIKFIEVCEQKRPTEETKKILSKLKKKYAELNSIYKDDKEFQNFLHLKIEAIFGNHSNQFYIHIYEVKREIKCRIKYSKKSISSEEKLSPNAEKQNTSEEEDAQEIELSKESTKQVRLLEKAIEQCQKRIKELEEKAVDFDEGEDSAYLQEDRYKRKLVQLCKALSKIVGDKMLKKEIYKKKIKCKDIPDKMTGISFIDEAIISFVNNNIDQLNKLKHITNPYVVADYIAVPDYQDILKCITKCNKKKSLELTKQKMEQLAKTAFKSIGFYLKQRRVRECEAYMSSYIEVGTEPDPALKDSNLYKQLQNSKKNGDKKLEEIFQKYVDKQEGMSPEDLEKRSEQESASEGNSHHEASKRSDEKRSNDNNSGNSFKFEESKSKDCEIKKDKMAEDNVGACSNKITISSDFCTCIVDVKETSSHNKENKINIIPLV